MADFSLTEYLPLAGKLLVGATVLAFTAIGALLYFIKMVLTTMTRQLKTLFDMTAEHDARIKALEMVALTTNPEKTLVQRVLMPTRTSK